MLNELSPRPGARHRRKRVGRGPGSGKGKTSGTGVKGQGTRSGQKIKPWFEGGQMPLVRRLPKRGFNNARHTVAYLPVNVSALNRFEDGTEVDLELLGKAGLANGQAAGVKILGNGKLERKLTVRAHRFSASAKAKIEQAGGACELVTRAAGA